MCSRNGEREHQIAAAPLDDDGIRDAVRTHLLRRLPETLPYGKSAPSVAYVSLLVSSCSALAREKFDGVLDDVIWRLIFLGFVVMAVLLLLFRRTQREESRTDFVDTFVAELCRPGSLEAINGWANEENQRQP